MVSFTLFLFNTVLFGTDKTLKINLSVMKKGTSSKPLRYGILGLITALPNSLLAFLSSNFVFNLDEALNKNGNINSNENIDNSILFMKLIFWSAIIGFLFSLISKRFYKTAGFGMIISGLLILVSMATANFFLIFPATFFIIGGSYCFTQEKINTKQK